MSREKKKKERKNKGTKPSKKKKTKHNGDRNSRYTFYERTKCEGLLLFLILFYFFP